MNKCDNPVYQKVTRRGKVCDICMKRSKGGKSINPFMIVSRG